MGNSIQAFNNEEFGTIRTVELNGEPWLIGKDVADVLGYQNGSRDINRHVDEDDKTTVAFHDSIQSRSMVVINESVLYSLVLSSKLPNAKKFKKWVTSEVLPSIRRSGGYIAGQETLSAEELMAKALMVAQKTLADREARISSLMVENQVLLPKAQYFDELVERNTLTNFRETAKELGVPPKKFTTFLLDKKYIYRDRRGKLLPTEAKNEGLFEVKESYNEKTKWSGTQTLITPKGRETFRLLMIGC